MSALASRLLGRRVVIVTSEPWELVDERGMNYFAGTIVAVTPFSSEVERETVLVDLAEVMTWRSVNYESILLGARHGEGLLDALSESDAVECNLIGISAEGRKRPDVLAMSGWRGGLAGVASVRLVR